MLKFLKTLIAVMAITAALPVSAQSISFEEAKEVAKGFSQGLPNFITHRDTGYALGRVSEHCTEVLLQTKTTVSLEKGERGSRVTTTPAADLMLYGILICNGKDATAHLGPKSIHVMGPVQVLEYRYIAGYLETVEEDVLRGIAEYKHVSNFFLDDSNWN